VAFLDASKPFDRVNYAALFCKLSARDVPGVILRLLICWYSGQSCSILWAGVISSVFFSLLMVFVKVVFCHPCCLIYIRELRSTLNCITTWLLSRSPDN